MKQDEIKSPITRLLREWRAGNDEALAHLMPAVYEELYRLAMGFMRRERAGHSMATGDLVHEAFLKLVDERERSFESRLHFFALASKIMKDVLSRYARARNAVKRGGDRLRVTLPNADRLSDADDLDTIEALGEGIAALASIDERKAWILQMYYYVGLSISEISLVMKLGSATVKRDLHFARTWLKKHLTSGTS